MRWELVKRAWTIAKQQYPDVRRLYVDIPGKFGAVGECRVIDLDNPSKPLGAISYDLRSVGNEPKMVLASGSSSVAVGTPKQASSHAVKTSVAAKAGTVALVASRYDGAEMPTQLALVAVGHEDGIKDAALGVSKAQVAGWLRSHSLDAGLTDKVCQAMQDLGVDTTEPSGFNMRVAVTNKAIFDKLQRVRIKDSSSMEFQECGQVLEIRGSFKDGYWYSVLVDGSEAPQWFRQENLDSLHAGWVAPTKAEAKDDKNAV